jgi:hypothetical protein
MKAITSLILCAGALALQGCAAEPSTSTEPEDVVTNNAAVTVGSANLVITSQWTGGYCATVTLTNGLAQATGRWQVVLDLKTSTLTSLSNAAYSGNTGTISVGPYNYNSPIAPGGNTAFNFCANTSTSVTPAIKAWNMESNAYATCNSNSGVQPTKAALAVAMAKDLGRWDPADLWSDQGRTWKVFLSGSAPCTNGCTNVKAILGQQTSGLINVIDQNLFNPETLKTELTASIQRQKDLTNNLRMNNPGALPPAHKLTMVAGPTNLGLGSCGPHYVFQVDHLDGTPLTATEANNMVNALCMFGQGTCGNNPYIAFATTSNGCPTGKTCVAIDPTDGDNSSTSTTTAGSAPTYPLNRVYDPQNTLLGTQCITTKGKLGTLTSKCSLYPDTCGYLYCTI